MTSVPPDGGIAPGPAHGAENPLLVQLMGNPSRRLPGGEGLEDAAHGHGFGGVNPAVAPDRVAVYIVGPDDIIAVCIAPTRLARLHTAPETPSGLFQVAGGDQASQTHMQLIDPSLRKRKDLYAHKTHTFVEAGDILLVTRQAIGCFGDKDIELLFVSIPDQVLDAGA